MKVPSKVRVAAFDIAIDMWHHKEATALARFGQFSAIEQAIKLDEAMNDVKMVDTLLHEINHSIFWAYGIEDEDKEERIVGTLATAWTQVYRDNPDLLEFIKFKLS